MREAQQKGKPGRALLMASIARCGVAIGTSSTQGWMCMASFTNACATASLSLRLPDSPAARACLFELSVPVTECVCGGVCVCVFAFDFLFYFVFLFYFIHFFHFFCLFVCLFVCVCVCVCVCDSFICPLSLGDAILFLQSNRPTDHPHNHREFLHNNQQVSHHVSQLVARPHNLRDNLLANQRDNQADNLVLSLRGNLLSSRPEYLAVNHLNNQRCSHQNNHHNNQRCSHLVVHPVNRHNNQRSVPQDNHHVNPQVINFLSYLF